MQTAVLAAGVLTVNEVRAMRGLGPLPEQAAQETVKEVDGTITLNNEETEG